MLVKGLTEALNPGLGGSKVDTFLVLEIPSFIPRLKGSWEPCLGTWLGQDLNDLWVKGQECSTPALSQGLEVSLRRKLLIPVRCSVSTV